MHYLSFFTISLPSLVMYGYFWYSFNLFIFILLVTNNYWTHIKCCYFKLCMTRRVLFQICDCFSFSKEYLFLKNFCSVYLLWHFPLIWIQEEDGYATNSTVHAELVWQWKNGNWLGNLTCLKWLHLWALHQGRCLSLAHE